MDTGWKSPSATGRIINQWTNPANAYADNASYATGQDNQWQSYENFGFNIPDGSTVDGVEARVEWYQQDVLSADNYLSYYLNSTAGQSGLKIPGLSTSLTLYVVGGATDLWTASPVLSDFDDVNFSLRVRLGDVGTIVYMDYVQVKIYYTEATSIKSWNGLAKASIKSINGLAIASIKSINGLA